MKDILTKEESAHLINLGVPKEKASSCIIYFNEEGEQIGSDEIEWAKEDGHEIDEELIDKNYSNYDHSYENDVSIFTLTDLLSILPNNIGERNRIVESGERGHFAYYCGANGSLGWKSAKEELIDALYDLACWCLEQKHLKFE